MCGICGIYAPIFSGTLLKEVKAMNALLHHRGPDDEGVFFNDIVALGHKRLSIIDLHTGKQPIFNEDRSCVIVYNGELYNYQTLREQLIRKGHEFSTQTDTEVVLHSYEEFGTACVQQFNGMFAFAIWDQNLRRLFLARDRLGIKPLYYHWDPLRCRFTFASEIKALLVDPHLKRQLHSRALSEYLVYQNLLDDKTFFESIHMLLPAHGCTVTDGKIEKWCYWHPSFQKTVRGNTEEYLHSFRDILKSTVKGQLMSDVPVGAYLSGGFDSSSVATMAAKFCESPLETFTGYFEEGRAYDERAAAQAVAEHIGARGHLLPIRELDFSSSLFNIVYHLDEPRVGPGAFPQFHVSRLVSQYVKVVLTGHGGDELFGGYPLYKMHYFGQLIKRNPLYIGTLLQNLKSGEGKAAIVNLLMPLFFPEMGLGLNLSLDYKKWKALIGPSLRPNLNGFNPLDTLGTLLQETPDNPVDRVQYLYLRTYLPSLFIVEDKVGMAHSIEARLPICDNAMVDFALSVPIEEKLKGYELKSIIKNSMRDELPSALYRQPKMGFPTPLSQWFQGGLKTFLQDVLLDEKCLDRGVFDPDIIRAFLNEHLTGRRNRQHVLWKMLNVEVWHRVFLDEGNYVPLCG